MYTHCLFPNSNSNPSIFYFHIYFWFPLYRNVTNNAVYGLLIESGDGANAMVYVNGEVTIDNNSDGIGADVDSGSNLNVVVNEGATLTSCKNTDYDITGNIESDTNVAFSGDGTYVCDQSKVLFTGDGNETVVEPTCQPCPLGLAIGPVPPSP